MKNLICLFIAILFAGAASAQQNTQTQPQFRTDISVREQIKGNAVPGMNYLKSDTKADVSKANIKTESKPVSTPTTNSSQQLPSDKKAEPVKQQPAPEMPKNITQ